MQLSSHRIPLSPNVGLLLGAVAISFSGVWVTIAEVSATTSAFYRVFFGFFFLLLIFLRMDKKQRPISPRGHLLLGLLCGFLFAGDLYCWHNAIQRIGPGLATLLGNFQVFVLAGIGILLLKERYSRLLLPAIPMAVFGLFLIVGLDWPNMNGTYRVGIYFGLATALFYSAYIICLRSLSGTSSNTIWVMMLVSLTTAFFLGIHIIFGGYSLVIPNLSSFASLLSLGFLSQCFGWLLIAVSLPKTTTSSAGLILLLQPSLAFVWDVLFFARPTTLLNWGGVFLTLAAIYLGLRSKKE